MSISVAPAFSSCIVADLTAGTPDVMNRVRVVEIADWRVP
jgi:hypothetical protein